MVRFGKTLEEQRVPEWASGYVDYKGLKKTLASMIASGSIQKFNENTVYSPISVATTEVVLAPPGPGELEFMAEVDAEIEKVNSFTLKLKEDLSNQVAAVRKQKEKWLRAGSPRAQAGQLITTVDAAACALGSLGEDGREVRRRARRPRARLNPPQAARDAGDGGAADDAAAAGPAPELPGDHVRGGRARQQV